jgi:hypothetical protein
MAQAFLSAHHLYYRRHVQPMTGARSLFALPRQCTPMVQVAPGR